MDKPSREASLRKTQDYLETLYREFESEIEKITLDIQLHKALRAEFETTPALDRGLKKRLQLWRRKSYALHRRRTRLKSMRDCLARQILDLQTARGQARTRADASFALGVCPTNCCLSPLDLRA